MEFIRLHLDEQARFLFMQMDPSDQRHALAVARTVMAKHGFQPGLPSAPLIQAALLHDAGKVRGDLSFLTRLAVGFLRRFSPGLQRRLADREGGPLARACYVDLHHPARGAYMARTFGVSPEVAALIRAHHDPPRPGEPKTLTHLREADGGN